MKRDKNFEVPFAVMRQIGTSMEDQLVSGFTRVIRSGLYADGMTLPGVRKLAMLFGVSEITVRNAVKRLCRDGLLAARPRVGLTVCASGGRSWRGVVLGIKAGPPGMYFAGVLESAMARILRLNGWLYSSIELPPRMSDDDEVMVDMLLSASVGLVVLFEAWPSLSALVAKRGVPFVEIHPHRRSEKAAFSVQLDFSAALANLARRFSAAGVRSVLSVYQHPSAARSFSAELEDQGLAVRDLQVRPIGGRNEQECIQRAGLRAFEAIFSKGAIPEDAIVCNDDYLSAGILSAVDRAGVRLPEDVRFATLSNKGLGPVYARDLDRIELDPAKSGASVGESIVSYLETGRVGGCAIVAEYRRGVTI